MNESSLSLSGGVKKRIIFWVCLCLIGACLIGGGLWWWLASRSQPLLPAEVTNRVKHFTPYFFEGLVPAGYSFDPKTISYDNEVLIIPLIKEGAPTVVLAEQPLPSNLKREDLQKDTEMLEGTLQPSALTEVEGRLVGSVIDTNRNVLILLNSPDSGNKENVVMLVRALKPVR